MIHRQIFTGQILITTDKTDLSRWQLQECRCSKILQKKLEKTSCDCYIFKNKNQEAKWQSEHGTEQKQLHC